MTGINWGDVPTWVAVAIATGGGAIALIQLRQQGNVLKGEVERNKARDELLDRQLGELYDRERSRMRKQAERIDVTWEDQEAIPGASLVVVINGSRRPIRKISCTVYVDENGSAVGPQYCAEMRPLDFPRQVYMMPKAPAEPETTICALRPGGRVGFQFAQRKAECHGGDAEVQFTDDEGIGWALSSDLALSLM